jgi:hypothetical protein
MQKAIMRLGMALVAAAFACAGAALAQQHRGGAPAVGAPHIGGGAPHIGGGAPAAPHFNAAPHINAAPHVSAPHINAGPRISAAPRFNAGPHVNTPRFSANRAVRGNVHNFAPRSRNFARQTVRGPVTRHAAVAHGRSVTGAAARNTRAATRNVGRNASRMTRAAGRGPIGAGTAATTNGRLGANRTGPVNRQFTGNGRNRPSGAQLATLSRPLGERNRNFGDRDRFFHERRRFAPGGFIGWFGPVFWPFAYDDFFDYAFWPYEYDNYAFWPYAYDDVLASVFWNPVPEDVYASVGAPQGRGRTRATSPTTEAYRAAAETCRAGNRGLTQWPVEEIAQVVQPDQDQQRLLDDLKAASAQGLKLLQTACPENPPSTPPARLDAIAKRLDVMVQALDIVRPALAKFYDSLSDEQKARFNAMRPQPGATANRGQGPAPAGEARLCGGQAPGAITSEAIGRIEREVRPTDRQNENLQALREASDKAAGLLRDACPSQTPITPVARVDAMKNRLQAMLDAINTVRPALVRFYDSLSDEQKAHFNIMTAQQG